MEGMRDKWNQNKLNSAVLIKTIEKTFARIRKKQTEKQKEFEKENGIQTSAFKTDQDYKEQVRRWNYARQYRLWF